jgi:NAD(P)-dependent dehydrogenase (short-subunit alcohol dehydrogenase family)
VITGANGGLGLETARVLAARGAHLVFGCRDLTKAERAMADLRASAPNASVELVRLDLADLDSVRDAAAEIIRRVERIDLLINNAAVMWPPFTRTEQGVELQFATNHLGHFALAGLLAKTLLASVGSRIVSVSSLGHWTVRNFDLDDLGFRSKYSAIEAYGRSKLANLLFSHELHRRLSSAGSTTISVASHPGGSRTELIRTTPRGPQSRLGPMVLRRLLQPQDAATGALTTLRAATDLAVRGGEYYGPRGPLEIRGYPELARCSKRSRDVELQARLWARSVELTGVDFPM